MAQLVYRADSRVAYISAKCKYFDWCCVEPINWLSTSLMRVGWCLASATRVCCWGNDEVSSSSRTQLLHQTTLTISGVPAVCVCVCVSVCLSVSEWLAAHQHNYCRFIQCHSCWMYWKVQENTQIKYNSEKTQNTAKQNCVASPTVWNLLPTEFHEPVCRFWCFRCTLKTILFARY